MSVSVLKKHYPSTWRHAPLGARVVYRVFHFFTRRMPVFAQLVRCAVSCEPEWMRPRPEVALHLKKRGKRVR